MSYAFEDYDAFLASFNNNNNNMNFKQGFQQQLQSTNTATGIAHDASLSNSIISTEDDAGILDPYYDYNQNSGANEANGSNNVNGELYLSPDSIINTSNSSSPNDFNLNNQDFNNFNDNGDFNFDEEVSQTQVKNESASSSSVTSPIASHPKAKLSKALPHSVISKRIGKKEKSSHNMIEKRYRTNINDKINALRDAVPALRVLVDSGDDEVDDNELDGLQPAKKLNKATILSKATEYIKHLETKNEHLRKENDNLKNRLYGLSNGNITPESSVGSVYSNEPRNNIQRTNTSSTYNSQTSNNNYANKFLLGGLACMVGAGLNDDFNNVDSTRSLFALPVFSFNQQGAQILSKPLLIMLKISLILCVLLNFVFPNIFQSKKDKKVAQVDSVATDALDIRNLSKISIWKTFTGKKDETNNEYVKKAIIRALKLKSSTLQQDFISQKITNLYLEHLWSYLKQIQLNSEGQDYDELKLILSLSNQETIHNQAYIKSLLEAEIKYTVDTEVSEDDETNQARDFSTIHILYNMINETKTNAILAKFMSATINSSFEPKEANDYSSQNINFELNSLFNPTDENISSLKSNLSKLSVDDVKDDEIFIMYASIIQNLIFIKKDFESAQKWFKKLDLKLINKFDLLGFTSLYIIILSMTKYQDLYQDDQDIISQIEEISGILRIWLGNKSGSSLKFEKRSQLIEFFVNVNLKINGLESLSGNRAVVV